MKTQFLCKLGLHKWCEWEKAAYLPLLTAAWISGSSRADMEYLFHFRKRRCSRCGKAQVMDVDNE